jgi:polyferredoxin
MLLMSALLLVRLMQGFGLARVGHSALTLALAVLSLEPSMLSLHTALSATALAISAVAGWQPFMGRWLGQRSAWRQALPMEKKRRLARHGLLYGVSWVLMAGISLVLDDFFNIPVPVEVLTFSLAMFIGGTLMGRYLIYLILHAPVPPRD